jgi:hypothetical protein
MSPQVLDYYAVLQVHPDAEPEVIEAAYRGLMRKYHPDVAGGDPDRAAWLHERAKAINQAYAVLRDPVQRANYDRMRESGRGRAAAPPPPTSAPDPRSAEAARHAASAPEVAADAEIDIAPPEPAWLKVVLAPLRALSSAYFLLPGTYEWDPGRNREITRALVIPPLGIAAWLIATGRLEAWVGNSLVTTIAIWVCLGLIAALTIGGVVVRLLLIGAPTLLLATGMLDTYLRSAGAPVWLAWAALSLLSAVFAARVYLFGVLPTVGICWLLARMP